MHRAPTSADASDGTPTSHLSASLGRLSPSSLTGPGDTCKAPGQRVVVGQRERLAGLRVANLGLFEIQKSNKWPTGIDSAEEGAH